MHKQYDFDDLKEIISRLRAEDGCPWDREQTHNSLKGAMLEEAYEVVEAIDIWEEKGEDTNLKEELGDILLQVMMHSQIASEEERFTIEDVIQEIAVKMIRRHPHVFGDKKAENSDEVIKNWDTIKMEEKKETKLSESLIRLPKAMPAAIRAQKVQMKAAQIGVGFQHVSDTIKAIKELLEKIQKEDPKRQEQNYEKLLFQVVYLSGFFGLNAENSLTNATNEFINKLVGIEHIAQVDGKNLEDMSKTELNTLWDE